MARSSSGTVQGDIHDIGKDIVFFMLDVNGFDVTDLGVDVPVVDVRREGPRDRARRRRPQRVPDSLVRTR